MEEAAEQMISVGDLIFIFQSKLHCEVATEPSKSQLNQPYTLFCFWAWILPTTSKIG
jgi:hypothetical protein